MCIIRQDLVGNRVDVIALLVLRDGELDQVGAFQRRPIHRIRPMLLNPRQDVCEIEDSSCGCADRMRKWLEGEGAEIKWQALECRVGASVSGPGNASARAG